MYLEGTNFKHMYTNALWTIGKLKWNHPRDVISTMELHSVVILINLQGAYFKVISSLFLYNLNDSQ